jgi:hypothetical protein
MSHRSRRLAVALLFAVMAAICPDAAAQTVVPLGPTSTVTVCPTS